MVRDKGEAKLLQLEKEPVNLKLTARKLNKTETHVGSFVLFSKGAKRHT